MSPLEIKLIELNYTCSVSDESAMITVVNDTPYSFVYSEKCKRLQYIIVGNQSDELDGFYTFDEAIKLITNNPT